MKSWRQNLSWNRISRINEYDYWNCKRRRALWMMEEFELWISLKGNGLSECLQNWVVNMGILNNCSISHWGDHWTHIKNLAVIWKLIIEIKTTSTNWIKLIELECLNLEKEFWAIVRKKGELVNLKAPTKMDFCSYKSHRVESKSSWNSNIRGNLCGHNKRNLIYPLCEWYSSAEWT